MRILRLTAENVKRLSVVDIAPNGNLVQITGKNGSGKSSVLDAMWYALAGKKAIDPEPVRKGAESASIRLDLGEIIVTRTFSEDGGTTLVVEAESGARFPSPQKMLDDMLGALTFDPLAFSRMAPKDQLDTLKKLVPLDVDIDTLDGQNRADYENRTALNRRLKSAAEAVNAAFALVLPSMDVTLINEGELIQQMAEAAEKNTAADRAHAKRESDLKTIADARALTLEKRERAKKLIAEADALEAQTDVTEAALPTVESLPEPVDVEELSGRINAAREENRRRSDQAHIREQHETAKASRDALEKESDELTSRIEARTKQKAEAIGRAKMPVPELGFGDTGVVFRSVPFEQASSAEQLRVSVALAMAANPKLRVLRIKDGSLLDETSLALIAGMADDADYQVWLERVDESGKVGVVMQDGAVAKVNE